MWGLGFASVPSGELLAGVRMAGVLSHPAQRGGTSRGAACVSPWEPATCSHPPRPVPCPQPDPEVHTQGWA